MTIILKDIFASIIFPPFTLVVRRGFQDWQNSEQLFIRKKIDEITREIQQLENNLSFFSSTETDNPLILNVKTKVNEFKEDLDVWKKKLNYIKKLDY